MLLVNLFKYFFNSSIALSANFPYSLSKVEEKNYGTDREGEILKTLDEGKMYDKKRDDVIAIPYQIRKELIEELVEIRDIGDVLAKNIVNYFANPINISLINTLEDMGVNKNPQLFHHLNHQYSWHFD